ncbi:hypothetical protein EVAR_65645_1 [Eumeta japonica]|uniref:Uncharacterized protein n=1 Tax=Eumeta variegata TaxID=151549 RepID=A0A4C1ZAB1_EUMVA|nr:hypothetical protein EVAR_65645_1 [Eumeta japonica]
MTPPAPRAPRHRSRLLDDAHKQIFPSTELKRFKRRGRTGARRRGAPNRIPARASAGAGRGARGRRLEGGAPSARARCRPPAPSTVYIFYERPKSAPTTTSWPPPAPRPAPRPTARAESDSGTDGRLFPRSVKAATGGGADMSARVHLRRARCRREICMRHGERGAGGARAGARCLTAD